jgi:predicted transcriptional regulator of viral defense system
METYNRLKNSGKIFFKSQDIKNILAIDSRRTLDYTVKKLLDNGTLAFVEKGKFYLKDLAPEKFDIAQYLYSPSYISLESALSYRGILSQFPAETTSVTTRKPLIKDVDGYIYSYAKINKGFFFGYDKVFDSLVATSDKAVFDYLYFISKGLKTESYLDEMDFTNVSKTKVSKYAKLLRNPKPVLNLIKKYL